MGETKSPLSRKQLTDLYFLEMRAKLIDVSAFLDRLDRARDAEAPTDDFRLEAMRRACQELLSRQAGRTERIQLCFSDPTPDPIPDASGLKGASGAYAPSCYLPAGEGRR